MIASPYYARTYFGDYGGATLGYVAPTVTTTAASGMTNSGATAGGNVTAAYGTVSARGTVWSTSNPTPTLGDCDGYTEDGTGTGSFVSTLAGLPAGATIYHAAYATDEYGTGYGTVDSFATLAASSVQSFSAEVGTSGDSILLRWVRGAAWPADMDAYQSAGLVLSVDGVEMIAAVPTGIAAVDGTTVSVLRLLDGTIYAGQAVTTVSVESGTAYSDGDPDNIQTEAVGSGVFVENGSTVSAPTASGVYGKHGKQRTGSSGAYGFHGRQSWDR